MDNVLTVIRKLNSEKVKTVIEESNGVLKAGDIKTHRISLSEIAERLCVDTDRLYEPLDTLLYSDCICDHSGTALTWGRKKGADGQISKSLGFWVEILM